MDNPPLVLKVASNGLWRQHSRMCEHLSTVHRTIAPFNEPSSIYWWAGNNQEGCHFDISTQNIIIGKLQAMLQQKGLAEVSVLHSGSSFSCCAHALVPC